MDILDGMRLHTLLPQGISNSTPRATAIGFLQFSVEHSGVCASINRPQRGTRRRGARHCTERIKLARRVSQDRDAMDTFKKWLSSLLCAISANSLVCGRADFRPAALSKLEGYGLGTRKHGPDHLSTPSTGRSPSCR